jgi:hypothetical protein
LPAAANWTAESNQASASFGWSVSTAGDVNGDGYSDVIVGSPNYDNGQTDEGRAYVYHGSASGLSPAANWTVESNQNYAYFGSCVSTAGDVNGDWYSDVVVGAYGYDNGETNEGRANVYYGSGSGLSTSADWTAESDQPGALFGSSVSTAGDVNGDGYSDVIVGAPHYNNGQTDEGKAYVFCGSVWGLSPGASWGAHGYQQYSEYGSSVSTAGDVNGDGYSDVIVGAPHYSNGVGYQGRALVYHGSASGLSSYANWIAEINLGNISFGHSVSTTGDINGDGYSDVIVGAHTYGYDRGRAYLFWGNSGIGLKATVRQYKPGSSNIVYSGGLTGSDGQVRLNIFGKSPYGRADGKIVYEYKVNGVPFSGSPLTNSTSYSGAGTMNDLGSALSGVQLNNDVSGLLTNKLYKWRARVLYSPVNNPFQKYGPWKYFNNYVPTPTGNFRASDGINLSSQLNLTMFIQGFYDAGSDVMVSDTVKVYLRNAASPYAVADSAKAPVNSSGLRTFIFPNEFNGIEYYIVLKHRNSIETWSKTPQAFSGNSLTYNFATANTQAYGDNMIQVDASPVRFGIYSGDVNQDGTVDATDVSMIDNDAFYFISGYVVTDLTGDNFVDGTDFAIADNNAASFVSVIRP